MPVPAMRGTGLAMVKAEIVLCLLEALIWIDLSSWGDSLHCRPPCGMTGTGYDRPVATVDHSDIRGLVTGLTSLHRGAASV